MKKVAIVTIAVLGFAFARAQYLPTTGQPFQFAPVYNPAFTGIDPYGDVRLSYRSQLGGGFGANSPSFFNGMYNFRLTQPADPNLNAMRTGRTSQPASSRAQGIVHGMGVNVFDEQLGLISRKGGGISYSFHFPVSEKLMLAVGTSAMIENLRIDADKVYLGANADPDPIYEDIIAGKANNNQINVRAGALLYSRAFYIGVSYLPVWRYELTESLLTASSIHRAALQTGVSFSLSETVELKPSIVALLSQDNHLNLDYGVKVYVKNMVWAGAMWRDTQTGVAQIGYNINKMFTAAYSYEISTGEWQFGMGSHELVLGIRLNNFRNQPSYIW